MKFKSNIIIEKEAFFEALRVCPQFLPGLFVWGIVTGIAMINSGLSISQASHMSLFVYAGIAQLAVLPLISSETPIFVILISIFLVNLRFIIFSALIGPHFLHLPWQKRLFFGYFNVDMVMIFFSKKFSTKSTYIVDGKVGYFQGLFIPSWIVWQFGSFFGIIASDRIPSYFDLTFAGILAMVTILIPLIVNKSLLVGVIFASITSILLVDLPYKLGVVLAIVVGIFSVTFIEKIKQLK